MYTIETDLGRFEGENEADAKKKLWAAERARKKADKERGKRGSMATMKANSQAYLFYSRLHRDERTLGWRYKGLGDSCRKGDDDRTFVIEGVDETVTANIYDGVAGYIENGAGFCIAIHIPNQDTELFAVGIHEGEIAFADMPGILIERYTRKNDEADVAPVAGDAH